jgi:putative membrane protein
VRWRRNEEAITADRPLPPSRVLPTLVAAVGAVLVVVAVLVGIDVLRR